MNTNLSFTVAEFAAHKKIYRQLALIRIKDMLSKGSIKLSVPRLVRGKGTTTYEFTDGSKLDLVGSVGVCNIDVRFFSDPFNRTGWRNDGQV